MRRFNIRAGRALLSAGVTAAVLFATAGTAQADGPDDTWYVPPGGVEVSPPPVGPWPEGGTFSVFMCKDDDPFEKCGKRAITAKQKKALEAKLRAMPQVAKVKFESRKEAWANFRKANSHNKALLSAIRAEDMPESFTGTLRRRADLVPFRSAFKKVAGVSNVVAWGNFFWPGKADVVISLCGPGTEPSDTCDGNGSTTPWAREKIEARLGTVEGVEKVYFQDAEHARREAAFIWVDKTFHSTKFSEAYYVKLADPRDAQVLIDTVKVLPGVSDAGLVSSR
ncbi:hypothetical protein GCM10010517_79290 [Streptosporangium fragile]|uniref:FtsX extracellular domain-containing protein n=1 Tax=Streptosporangium fragile TaxID=46186 RepID=A0ABN3WFF0_9ACTN